MSAPARQATIADLYDHDGKAELIDGRIVLYPPKGYASCVAKDNIFYSLHIHARTRDGKAFTTSLGYVIPRLPNGRESFCADTSYYRGPLPDDPWSFIYGPPTFAVEVRGEPDYGPVADAERADKREDYFQAGTPVVWDVDPMAETITCYRHQPAVVFRRGQTADAEPAVAGWRITVDDVFDEGGS
jgi:Uma2 family endonuclease